MLLFKKIDAYAQLVLIVAGLLLGLALPTPYFIISYFVVGGWQVLSAIIHLLGFNKMPAFKGRKWYLFMLLFLLVAGLLCTIDMELILYFGLGLLFVSPLLAIWYATICFGELKLWEQHETPEII